jgi:hypothetical protein
MNADQIPEVDGANLVGLARIIDVVRLVVDPLNNFDGTEAERRRRETLVRRVLFQVRDLGGRVGVTSHAWDVCGMTVPGVFVLDPQAKEVIGLFPRDTSC